MEYDIELNRAFIRKIGSFRVLEKARKVERRQNRRTAVHLGFTLFLAFEALWVLQFIAARAIITFIH